MPKSILRLKMNLVGVQFSKYVEKYKAKNHIYDDTIFSEDPETTPELLTPRRV